MSPAKEARAAGHGGHQTERGRPVAYRQPGFVQAADATDFYAGCLRHDLALSITERQRRQIVCVT